MKSEFNLGTIKTTFFAQQALSRAGQQASDFLNLHKQANWGEVTTEESQKNDQVVKSKDKTNKQILSAYTTTFNEETIWILTRFTQNGSTTTILLPREYDIIFEK